MAKTIEKFTADFNKYAGDDKLLSAAELTTLVKEVGPRVGRHRHHHHKGKHGDRLKLSWADLIAKFDKDGDGKLDQTEFEAIRPVMRAEREERRSHEGDRDNNDKDDDREDDKDDDRDAAVVPPTPAAAS
jgi:hypothetical protein